MTYAWEPFVNLDLCGRSWRLERALDMEALWEAMNDFDEDERLPYWAELWPSSLVLAEYLQKRQADILGVPCLDIGCGIGLTALVATWLGASVIGMDYEFDALRYAQKNAAHNGITPLLWVLMDWRFPAVQARSVQRIWGGDIMYEQRFADSLLHFFSYALANDGTVWIAEPTRSVYDVFRAKLAAYGFWGRCVHEGKVSSLVPQVAKVPVRLWELKRLNAV